MTVVALSPRVSVIIPVYNRIIYLGATIESVLNQSYRNWELIVVDDGSEEDVKSFLLRYVDPRIMFLRQANQGNAVARNTGIKYSKGEFLACLDSDDVWRPEMLQTCVTALETSPQVDVVYTQFQQIDGEGKPISKPPEPDPKNGDLLEPLLMGYPILPSSAVVRHRCLERWGMYTPGLDDWELWLRWAAKGCQFRCIEQPLLSYRIHVQNFNLNWTRRRQIHFDMLNTFYALNDLPFPAIRMRNWVYANQHLNFAVLAWQVGRPDDGLAESARAVQTNPGLLEDIDFYTKIACAHQGRLDMGTVHKLDFETAQHIVNKSLDAIFSQRELPGIVRQQRSAAYGWAYLALARLAYAMSPHQTLALKFLWQSIVAWPPIAWQTDWAIWFVRAVIGYRSLQRFKELLSLRRMTAQDV